VHHPHHLLVSHPIIIFIVFAMFLTLCLSDTPPAPALRRNRVTIEDWPDPEEDFDGDFDEDNNNPPADGEDQDPPYIEPDPHQGFNPEDEPALNDDELWDFLQAELGDLADGEWIDMCEYMLYIFLL
jgi:hypothetical protein